MGVRPSRPAAAALAVSLVPALACGGGEPHVRGSDEVRVQVPSRELASFGAASFGSEEGAPIIERGAELLVADGRALVVDRSGGRVLRLSLAGEHLSTIGRPGRGPGELLAPANVELGPEGDVWVSDPRSSRITRFEPEGELVGTYPTPAPVTDFLVDAEGRVLVPSLSRDELFTAIGPDGRPREVTLEVPLPRELGALSAFERLGFLRLLLTSVDARTHYLLVNREEFSLWRIHLDPGRLTVTGVREVPLPAWLKAAMSEAHERERESLEEVDAEFIPFHNMRATSDGRLWLTTAPLRQIGVAVDPEGRESSLVVLPSDAEEHRGLTHAVLAEGRLAGLYATAVRVYELRAARHAP